ncbi:MAG: conjugal transfer protein TraO [Prevotella sp.]|nr:conjugal transfer protein TraO [Prevotella sp.]
MYGQEKVLRIVICAVVLLVLFGGQAHAQRCLPGMRGIAVTGDVADGFASRDRQTGYSLGAALERYARGGNKWVFGAKYLYKEYPYENKTIPMAQFTAEGAYFKKIIADAKKIIFLYAGISALGGYETVNWGEKSLSDGSTLHDKDAFIYGGAVTLETEIYIFDGIALTANIRERCLWGGDTGRYHTEYGVGVKIIIN